MKRELLDRAVAEAAARRRAILVAIVEVAGSTPRERGAAMLVAASGAIAGTIGGGSAEHRSIAIARRMLDDPAPAPQVEAFALNPVLDQCCGGRMTVAFAPLDADDAPRLAAAGDALELWAGGPAIPIEPPPRPAFVFGGGHVGAALVSVLAPLPFRVRWIDARLDGFLGPAPAGVASVATPLPEAEIRNAPAGAFHLVMTHSHALDLEIVAAGMEEGRFGFLGLIGSATKRALFARRLAERGIDADRIARLACPIGIPGIPGKEPAVIAASTAAQLLLADAALRGVG